MRRTVPKELYWLLLTVVLLSISLFFVVKRSFHLGLDISGGIRAILQAEPRPGQVVDSPTIIKVISNRIDAFGVAEPVIQPRGNDQFTVELPNVKNKDEIINQLQATAQLEFRYFKDVRSNRNPGARYDLESPKSAPGTTAFFDNETGRGFRDQAAIVKDFQNDILSTSEQRPTATLAVVPAPLVQFTSDGQQLYLTSTQLSEMNALAQELSDYDTLIADSPIEMTGEDIKSNASSSLDPNKGPAVNLTTTDKGVTLLANFSTAHVNELMAIILDGKVLSAATIDEPLTDGTCQISGGFATLNEAQSLANLLNAGALPMPLKIISNYSVAGTLGPEAVHSSLMAGAIGLGAVMIFMAAYYLLPGLLADLALIIYALFTLAVFKGALGWLGLPYVTLTLPGIAGFILSVGMAVDANILIFERLKEELRNGKSLKASIDAGFTRAFTAIRDSNLCTLITCMILFSMGTAEVKGFALTLGIGVLISLFTAITVTRTFLYVLVALGAGKNLALFGLGRQWEPNFNAVKNRKYFYALSLLIIIPGIIAFLAGGLKQGIDFTGGTEIQAVFNQPVERTALVKSLVDGGYRDNLVIMASKDNHENEIAFITVKNTELNTYLSVERAINNVTTQYTLESHQVVGPQISKELVRDAIEAVVIAACLIVLYLATAFSIGGFVAGLRFGASAIIALFHDVFVLVGVFSIMGFVLNWEVNSLFVTAVLTVVGFSVHDTIVIFDRLRENLRHRSKSENFENLANRSVQQSFARSINTSFTVVLTLVALLVFGEPSTKLLDWALLIGIVSGTYSSIFNATPILVDWEMWLAKRGSASAQTNQPTFVATPAPAPSSFATTTTLTSDSSEPALNGAAVSHTKVKKRSSTGRRF